MLPIIATFAWVPPFARGFVRDIRARWACEKVGQPYEVVLVHNAKTPERRCYQPFGQVPTYRDDEVEILESGAIVLRIAERAAQLIPILRRVSARSSGSSPRSIRRSRSSWR